MIRIKSNVSRSWPAHDLEIKVGDNEFDSLTPGQRGFLQSYIEGGQMQLEEDRKPARDTTGDRTYTAPVEGPFVPPGTVIPAIVDATQSPRTHNANPPAQVEQQRLPPGHLPSAELTPTGEIKRVGPERVENVKQATQTQAQAEAQAAAQRAQAARAATPASVPPQPPPPAGVRK